ncbi:hypothetical protein DQ353_20800 [Arthrobacter sp. AQ5-05]|uniref:LssY C-terminal domain-containing protein n=1 Tax=Arthrobacter sp. AQ5-05 TaxID=2184581 RepID=UPI000DCDA990|nr:LssY C-terminal domain-containing protein [Arthrobacter sp. AQ5-05]RAX45952.1 hypothetical protein DQ353_20800 [Arthrobacter sp. AQ5-05]
MPGSRTVKHAVLSLLVVGLSLLNLYVAKNLDVVGIPFFLAVALLVQLLLLVTFVFSLAVVLKTPLVILCSIAGSAAQGAGKNHYVRTARTRYPRLTAWVLQRFSPRDPRGLLLTLGAVASLASLAFFLAITGAVMAQSTYAAIDQRILNLVPYIRSSGQNRFFVFFTFGASSLSLVFFLLVLGVAVWRTPKHRWLFVLFAGSAILTRLGSTAAKHLIGRSRPDRSLALVTENSFGFPSGHTLTAVVISGLFAYLLIRVSKPYALKLSIVLATITMVLLVGLSRIYLGVHYPSDILGSLALGLCFLAIIITCVEIVVRYGVLTSVRLGTNIVRPLLVAAAATLLFAGFFGTGLTPLSTVPSPSTEHPLTDIDKTTVKDLPDYSETLTGSRMEPISFIFLGSQDQIESMFVRAGWHKADPSTPANTLRAIVVAIRNEQYLTAPVTPSYLDAEPETMAFEKPTDTNTLVQRHHTRIWKTNFTVKGQPVWVATASFDEGIGLAKRTGLPTHHIDPNVDAERSYILGSLGIKDPRMIRVADPQLGQNATGDGFFTDGQAAIINAGDPALR